MSTRQKVAFFIFILSVFSIPYADESGKPVTLRMVYQDVDKSPFMQEAPDNSGIYLDIYSAAAEKLGWDLVISRFPKKRALLNVMSGEDNNDFYAIRKLSDSTSAEEIDKLYWFYTGMTREYVYVSRIDTPEINSLEEFRKYTLLTGSVPVSIESSIKDNFNANVVLIAGGHIERLAEGLRIKRGDLFNIDSITARVFIEHSDIKDIKIQNSAFMSSLEINNNVKLTMAFARSSPLLDLSPNPNYDKTKPVTVDNFPVIADPECPAAKFAAVVNELALNGTIDNIYSKNISLP